MVEICALIICSCIPSLRQVIAKIPGLNSILGLSSGGDSRRYFTRSGQKNLSIPLQSRSRKEYLQSQRSKTRSRHGSIPLGMTSHVTAAAMMDGISEHGSQEEIFPYKSDQSGGIVVTTEVQHHIEASGEGSATYTDASSQHQAELSSVIQRPEPAITSPIKSSSDMSWLRRSK